MGGAGRRGEGLGWAFIGMYLCRVMMSIWAAPLPRPLCGSQWTRLPHAWIGSRSLATASMQGNSWLDLSCYWTREGNSPSRPPRPRPHTSTTSCQVGYAPSYRRLALRWVWLQGVWSHISHLHSLSLLLLLPHAHAPSSSCHAHTHTPPGAVLGCAGHEEVPAVAGDVAIGGDGMWRDRHTLREHQEHQREPKLPQTSHLL